MDNIMGGGPIQASSAGHSAGITPMFDIGGNRGDNDFGGGGIWAILLLALLGRGNGFGGGNDGHNFGAEIHTSDRFNQLSDQVNFGAAASVTATNHQGQLEATRDVDKSVCNGSLQAAIDQGKTYIELCRGFGITNDNINQGFGQSRLDTCNGFSLTNSNIAEAKFANLLGQKELSSQIADCCCRLEVSGMQNTQKILDRMCTTEVQDLRDKLAETRLGFSQCQQNAAIIGALAPKPPVAAYPVWNNAPIFTPSVSAQSFCGFGNTPFQQGGTCGLL